MTLRKSKTLIVLIMCAVWMFFVFLEGCGGKAPIHGSTSEDQTMVGDIEVPKEIYDPSKCDIYLRYEANPDNSLIAKYIPDPCTAKKIIQAAATLPAVKWEMEYIEHYGKWSTDAKVILETDLTYDDAYNIITSLVYKVNEKAGLALFIVNTVDVMPFQGSNQIVLPVDKAMLINLVKQTDVKVAMIANFLIGSEVKQ